MPETPDIPDELPLADAVEATPSAPEGETVVEIGANGNLEESNNEKNEETPVIDVHAPHGGVHTWKDFWIHLGTIAAGLLIAISLEQSVEALHHLHQRHQLQEDLQEEAEANRKLILDDLALTRQEAWFGAAMKQVAEAAPRGGKVIVSLPPAPCAPESIITTGTTGYLSPSEVVWTTAKDRGQVALLPAKEGRIYARLSHINDLLLSNRTNYITACDKVWAMERRFAVPGANGTNETWTMDPQQAEAFAAAAADAQAAFRGLVYRLRYILTYEEALLAGSDINQIITKLGQLNENEPLPEEKP